MDQSRTLDDRQKGRRQIMSHEHSKPVSRFGMAGAVQFAAPILQNLKQFFDWHILPAGRGQGKSAHHALRPTARAAKSESRCAKRHPAASRRRVPLHRPPPAIA